jgi:hypothetical protein
MEIAHRAKIVLQEIIEYVITIVIKEGVVNAQTIARKNQKESLGFIYYFCHWE